MYIMILEDICTHQADGVITSIVTTPKEIQNIISEVKNTVECWTIEDIIQVLPQDAKLYMIDGNNFCYICHIYY